MILPNIGMINQFNDKTSLRSGDEKHGLFKLISQTESNNATSTFLVKTCRIHKKLHFSPKIVGFKI